MAWGEWVGKCCGAVAAGVKSAASKIAGVVRHSWETFRKKRALEQMRLWIRRTLGGLLEGLTTGIGLNLALIGMGAIAVTLYNWAIIVGVALLSCAKFIVHLFPDGVKQRRALLFFKTLAQFMSTMVLLNGFAGLFLSTPVSIIRTVFGTGVAVGAFNATVDRVYDDTKPSDYPRGCSLKKVVFAGLKALREATGWADFAGAFALFCQAIFNYPPGELDALSITMLAVAGAIRALFSLFQLLPSLCFARFTHFMIDYVLEPLAKSLALASLGWILVLTVEYALIPVSVSFTDPQAYGPLAMFFGAFLLNLLERVLKSFNRDGIALQAAQARGEVGLDTSRISYAALRQDRERQALFSFKPPNSVDGTLGEPLMSKHDGQSVELKTL